jgi:polyketide synthase PksJ
MNENLDNVNDTAVAIIGMSCRFPLGSDIHTYWENLRQGIEAVRFLSDEELLRAGVSKTMVADKDYVPAVSAIEDIECFDAEFFGFSRREAEILDPQQRLLLECAYHALEQAGYALGSETPRVSRNVGVYVGAATSTYAYQNLLTHPDLVDAMGVMNMSIGNEKDFVAAQIAFRLNLTGPAVNINTACSTSLVAVHHAANSLINYECDMALAGGATVRAQQEQGYLYAEGGILSADGHCRPFSSESNGTLDGNGAGVVLLKRLVDAIADGDHIHAVIESSAINNDGSDKMGITAPSVKGQARVVHEAIVLAEISANDIGYIEAHGTGTKMGDPIEISALNDAFSASATSDSERQYCAIGSVKSNMGHLDAAAGIAGLIKATLAVEHAEIPPSLHAANTNPEIDFDNSPFYVANDLQPWRSNGHRRFAGVSSFGIGGTNAHVILGQAPSVEKTQEEVAATHYLLPISAQTTDGLMAMMASLQGYLSGRSLTKPQAISVADICYSLSLRPDYSCRYACLVTSVDDAFDALIAMTSNEKLSQDTNLLSSYTQQQLGDRQTVLLAEYVGNSGYLDRITDLHRQAAAWTKGESVDIGSLFQAGAYNKTPLPGYAFVRERLWVEPAETLYQQSNTEPEVARDERATYNQGPRLYCYEWRSLPLLKTNRAQAESPVRDESESVNGQLVFKDKGGVAESLYLGDRNCVTVSDAADFSQPSKSMFELNLSAVDQLSKLAGKLREYKASVTVIECFTFLDIDENVNDSSNYSQHLLGWQKRLLNLIDFVKEYARNSADLPLLRVYLRNAFSVTGNEDLSPIARAISAMLVVVNQELAEFNVQVVDLEPSADLGLLKRAQAHLDRRHFTQEPAIQLAESKDEIFYVVRGKKLWLRFFRTEEGATISGDTLERDSVAVFIGGLGQVGQEVSKHLSMLFKHLIIIGRKELTQLDGAAQSALESMRMINSQVEYNAVDISDHNQLSDCLKRIAREHGPINMLIHGAGEMNQQRMCSHDRSGEADLVAQHQAKVKGSLNLISLAEEIDIEKIIATSSLSASLGGLGMMAYSAANAFMDALAEKTLKTCEFYSIDFDGLAGVKTLGNNENVAEAHIDAKQFVDLIVHLQTEQEPGLWLYAHGELNDRWQRSIRKVSLHVDNVGADGHQDILGDEIEPQLILLYESLTGHQGIKPDDNFFAVGGDSVTATQLRMLIERKFVVEISIEAIFDRPVVGDLSRFIKNLREGPSNDDDDELAKLLQQVAEMDEVELEKLLQDDS